jgi:hypothetical protein
MSDQPKPRPACPVCGGTAEMVDDSGGWDHFINFWIQCSACKARPQLSSPTKKGAEELWQEWAKETKR